MGAALNDRWAGRRLVAATRLDTAEAKLRTVLHRTLNAARDATLAHVRTLTAALPAASALAAALAAAALPVASEVFGQIDRDVSRAFTAELPAYDLTGRLERVDAFVSELGADTVAALDDTLTEGANLGESVPQLSARVRDVFGASQARANNIARTEVVGASNQMANDQAQTAAAAGLSLWGTWLATLDDRTRETHAAADGQTVPLGQPFEVGDDLLMYPGDPDGSPEEVCNCVTGETLVELPGLRASLRRWYEGDLVELGFASGRNLTVTPNHPILRANGRWESAQDLNLGDDCISGRLVRESPAEPDVERVPATAAEFYAAADHVRSAERVRGRPPHFHGDGGHGEVEVVAADGNLWVSENPATGEHLVEFGLSLADLRRSDPGGRRSCSVPVGSDFPQDSSILAEAGVCGGGQGSALRQRSPVHAYLHSGSLVPRLDSRFEQPAPDDGSRDPERDGDSHLGFTLEISADQVRHVKRYAARARVYNFDTGHGWYISNGIVTGNCRCTVTYDDQPPGDAPADESAPDGEPA